MEVNELVVSLRSVNDITHFEISSEWYYNKFLEHPYLPGLSSGITIGIGYDLGYHTAEQFQDDWEGYLSQEDINCLKQVCGLRGKVATVSLQLVQHIIIPFASCSYVFQNKSLQIACKSLVSTYPGAQNLRPNASGGLLSLVYNRGCLLVGARREEMAAIKPLVAVQDYAGIANQILAMRKYWDGAYTHNNGLVYRRVEEAALVLNEEDLQPQDMRAFTF